MRVFPYPNTSAAPPAPSRSISVNLTRQTTGAQPQIQRYGSGGFRIAGEVYTGSVIVHPSGVVIWPVLTLDEIAPEAFASLIALAGRVDVCLFGCGPQLRPLPRELRNRLKEAGLPHDPMDTGAACRTYNVLAGEGRAVAAALIAV